MIAEEVCNSKFLKGDENLNTGTVLWKTFLVGKLLKKEQCTEAAEYGTYRCYRTTDNAMHRIYGIAKWPNIRPNQQMGLLKPRGYRNTQLFLAIYDTIWSRVDNLGEQSIICSKICLLQFNKLSDIRYPVHP